MVLKYRVIFTNEAFNDLEQIHSYIKDTLFNPKSADKIYVDLFKQCLSLNTSPNRFDIYSKNPTIRFVPVKNYLIFYCVDNLKFTVQILRFYIVKGT